MSEDSYATRWRQRAAAQQVSSTLSHLSTDGFGVRNVGPTVKWNLNDERMHYRLNIMENVATAFVFIIVVVNVFITAFGVQRPNTSS